MAPEPHHRTAVFLRALITSALVALAWLVIDAASAHADAGSAPLPSLASSVLITPQRATQALAPTDRLPLTGPAGATPTLPVAGVPAVVVPSPAVVGTTELAVNDVVDAVAAEAAVTLPQVPELPALRLPVPPPSAVLEDPSVVPDLPLPLVLPASDSPADATILPSPRAGTAPSVELLRTSTTPPSRAGTPVDRAASPLLDSRSAEVSTWTGGGSSTPGNGSGHPLHVPLTPPEVSGLAAGSCSGDGTSSQTAAEPAYVGHSRDPQDAGQSSRDNWNLPENQAFPPGSSPD